jgi:hypothetical protein
MNIQRQVRIDGIAKTWTAENSDLLKSVLNEMTQDDQQEKFWTTALDYELVEIANAIIEAE